MFEYSEIGSAIAKIRKDKGLTQNEIADKLIINRSSYNQIENGKRALDLLEFISISRILGFSIDDFLKKIEEKLPNDYKIDAIYNIVPVTIAKTYLNDINEKSKKEQKSISTIINSLIVKEFDSIERNEKVIQNKKIFPVHLEDEFLLNLADYMVRGDKYQAIKVRKQLDGKGIEFVFDSYFSEAIKDRSRRIYICINPFFHSEVWDHWVNPFYDGESKDTCCEKLNLSNRRIQLLIDEHLNSNSWTDVNPRFYSHQISKIINDNGTLKFAENV